MASAAQFYSAKVTEIGRNIQDLEGIVQQKGENIRALNEG